MKAYLKYLMMVAVLLGGCQADLHTKKMAVASLKNEKPINIIAGYLDLTYTENRGVVFSLFHDFAPNIRHPFLVASTLLPSLVIALLIIIGRRKSFWLLLPFVLILSGAMGNLIDRIRNGYVVDFIYFHVKNHFHWGIFNVADVLIVIGIGLLLLQTLLLKDTILTIPSKRPSAEPL